MNESVTPVPTADGPNRLAPFEIRTYRVLFAVSLVLIVTMRVGSLASGVRAVDPLWGRVLMAALCTSVLAATWVADTTALRRLVYAAYYAITGWLLLLTWLNAFSYEYALAL
ncbi:MAG: hypothetical protein ACREKM_10380, partial [Longimicrobiales bacterium]